MSAFFGLYRMVPLAQGAFTSLYGLRAVFYDMCTATASVTSHILAESTDMPIFLASYALGHPRVLNKPIAELDFTLMD